MRSRLLLPPEGLLGGLGEAEQGPEGDKGLIDNELRAVSIAVLLVLGVGAAGQYYLPGHLSQPYSEIGILGPTGKFGGYGVNGTMTVGTSYPLELYVADHAGHSMLYEVYEKVGSQSSVISQTTPLSSPAVAVYWFALPDNGAVTQPINASVSAPGQNVRLVWELWYYSASGSWAYAGSWAQIYVNATES